MVNPTSAAGQTQVKPPGEVYGRPMSESESIKDQYSVELRVPFLAMVGPERGGLPSLGLGVTLLDRDRESRFRGRRIVHKDECSLRLVGQITHQPGQVARGHHAQALAHHYGTFQLTDEAIDAPVIALGEALDRAEIAREKFTALKPGQVFEV